MADTLVHDRTKATGRHAQKLFHRRYDADLLGCPHAPITPSTCAQIAIMAKNKLIDVRANASSATARTM
jgi:hypothetical protein